MEEENEKEKRNIESALFHTYGYKNDADLAVFKRSIDDNRKILFDMLSRVDEIDLKNKNYFRILHKLFKNSKWEHLLSPDKVLFFKRWFTVVSDEYIKAFTIMKSFNPNFTCDAYLLESTVLYPPKHLSRSSQVVVFLKIDSFNYEFREGSL